MVLLPPSPTWSSIPNCRSERRPSFVSKHHSTLACLADISVRHFGFSIQKNQYSFIKSLSMSYGKRSFDNFPKCVEKASRIFARLRPKDLSLCWPLLS